MPGRTFFPACYSIGSTFSCPLLELTLGAGDKTGKDPQLSSMFLQLQPAQVVLVSGIFTWELKVMARMAPSRVQCRSSRVQPGFVCLFNIQCAKQSCQAGVVSRFEEQQDEETGLEWWSSLHSATQSANSVSTVRFWSFSVRSRVTEIHSHERSQGQGKVFITEYTQGPQKLEEPLEGPLLRSLITNCRFCCCLFVKGNKEEWRLAKEEVHRRGCEVDTIRLLPWPPKGSYTTLPYRMTSPYRARKKPRNRILPHPPTDKGFPWVSTPLPFNSGTP